MNVVLCRPSLLRVWSYHLLKSCLPRKTLVSSLRNCSRIFKALALAVGFKPCKGVSLWLTRLMKMSWSSLSPKLLSVVTSAFGNDFREVMLRLGLM